MRLIGLALAIACVTSLLSAAALPDASASMKWVGGGPDGGYVRQIAFDPASPSHVLATTSRGVYRSEDGGSTWEWASADLPDLRTIPVTFNAKVPGEAYVGTPSGIFRTTDAGLTWSLLTDETNHMRPLNIHADGEVMYAWAEWHLLRSRDGGRSWTQVFWDNRHQIGAVAVAPSDPGILYMSVADILFEDRSADSVMKSTDGGDTWQDTALTKWGADLAVDPRDPDVVYAPTGVVNITRDGGQTWEEIFGGVFDVTIAPSNPDVVYGSGHFYNLPGHLGRSDDAGRDWHDITPLPGAERVVTIAVDPSDPDHILASGSDIGLFASHDGGQSFALSSKGLAASLITDIATDPERPNVMVATTEWGLFRSDDSGATWVSISGGLADPADPFRRKTYRSLVWGPGSTLFVSRTDWSTATDSELFRSTDDGTTWNQVGDLPGVPGDVLFEDSALEKALVATSAGVFRSPDGGTTWGPIVELPDTTGEIVINSIERETNGSDVYASFGWNDEAGTSSLFRTSDFGASWDALGRIPVQASDLTIVSDPQGGPDVIYAGNARWGTVAISTDGGATWENRYVSNPPVSEILVIEADPIDPLQVLVGTHSDGVWASGDLAQSWRPVTSNVRGQFVGDLEFVEDEQRQLMSTTDLGDVPAFAAIDGKRVSGVAQVIPAPNAYRRPKMTGRSRVGEILTCRPGRWSRMDTLIFEWERSGEVIARATDATYRVSKRDRGRGLRCKVIAHGPGGRTREFTRSSRVGYG